eukprot:TRINITY_DN32683_c0_g2_i1.p1 TRINITY_DN32683_c0_g2~~TRINITY_DN32683_c0_g2_i1.p1  ORF type:complete len:312 (+),score=29.87 TRINITY_DN32683_c0_g2_i1:18-953(+)
MNTNRTCGCKGHRSCFICEEKYGIKHVSTIPDIPIKYYDRDKKEIHDLGFSGIHIIKDFVSKEEEEKLVEDLDYLPWDSSQSGRRKQNFGPKANFKKRKTKKGNFCGFPESTKFLQERFKSVPLLAGYKTVEQCSIEYDPDKGASIEPHIDDCWIWGERIVQVNLKSDTYLSFIPYKGNNTRYNLQDVQKYPRIIDDKSKVVFNPYEVDDTTKLSHETTENSCYSTTLNINEVPDVMVKVHLPARSLLIMYGNARYEWEHFILREDISSRRVIIAYREFTPPYLPGGSLYSIGEDILAEACKFWTTKSEDQ